MWSSTALLLAHHESGSELNLTSLVCCPHCPQHFLCAQGHNEYDTLLIGEVGGLQRHVLRLAQLLICICKAGDRAEGPLPDQKRFRERRTPISMVFIGSVACLVGKCEIAV